MKLKQLELRVAYIDFLISMFRFQSSASAGPKHTRHFVHSIEGIDWNTLHCRLTFLPHDVRFLFKSTECKVLHLLCATNLVCSTLDAALR